MSWRIEISEPAQIPRSRACVCAREALGSHRPIRLAFLVAPVLPVSRRARQERWWSVSAKILSTSARIAVAGLVLATSVVAQSGSEIAFVHVASPEQRLRYLATAQIWLDPGNVTPEMILAGRPLKESKELEGALRGEPLSCDFAQPGRPSAATRRNLRA